MVGRPAIGRQVPVRFPDDLRGKLNAYASEHGISFAEAVRRLLIAGLERTDIEEWMQ
jgi:plasmid stability protein